MDHINSSIILTQLLKSIVYLLNISSLIALNLQSKCRRSSFKNVCWQTSGSTLSHLDIKKKRKSYPNKKKQQQ